jgi:hypothetical protein
MKVYLILSVFAFSFLPFLAFSQETLTISTYYPSPYGNYRELRAQRMAIGDNYINGASYSWDTGTIDANADLVVEGNVGIGTANPLTYLNVVGPNVPTMGQIRIDSADAQSITFWSGGSQTAHWYYSKTTGLMQISNQVTGAVIDFTSDGKIRLGASTVYTDGNVGIGTASPGEKLEVNGNIRAGSFFYPSDERLKTNITRLSNGLEQVAMLNGSYFTWKADGRKDIGLSAQNVEKVYPELVKTDPITGLKSLEYGRLIAPLVEAVKTLKKQNESQEARIRHLQLQIEELRKRVIK